MHVMFFLHLRLRGLCAFDDKRFPLSDGINTPARGHYCMLGQITNMFEEAEQ